MSVRYRITHIETINGNNVEYRADISDSEYSGSIVEKQAVERFFSYEVEEIDFRQPLQNPVQKSSFTVNLLFKNGDDTSLINNIAGAELGRFTVDYYINSTLEWSGIVLTGLTSRPEGPYPWNFRVTAKDLVWTDKYFPRAATATITRLSEIIAECLKSTGLTLPIRSFTNLTHSEVTEANDFLYEVFHEKKVFQNETTEFTYQQVLEHICWRYNLIIRQAGGRWYVEQLPAIAKGNDTQFDYDSDGLNPTSSTPARAITVDKNDTFVLPGGQRTNLDGLKELRTRYNHRTSIQTTSLEDVTRNLQFEEIPTQSTSINGASAGDSVTFEVSVQMFGDTISDGDIGIAYMELMFERTDGANINLTSAGTFVTRSSSIGIGLTSELIGSTYYLTATDSITATIPDYVSLPINSVTAKFKWGEINSDRSLVGNITYKDMSIETTVDERDYGASKNYKYTWDGDFSNIEEIPATVLGEGVGIGSRGVPYGSGVGSSQLTAGQWKIRGVSESVGLLEITAREYMSMRTQPIENGRFRVYSAYSAKNLLNYDSTSWFFLGGAFSANGSRWDGNFLALDYLAPTGEGFSDFTPDNQTNRKTDLGGPPGLFRFSAIGETTQEITGVEVSSIDVDLDVVFRSGYEYWVINENELSKTDRYAGVYPIMPLEVGGVTTEYGPGQITLDIDGQYINAPEGSLIFKAPGQEEINQTDHDERIKEGEDSLDNLNNVELPQLQSDLDAAEADLATLNNTTLPNLQSDLDAAEADINTLETVTIPNLQSELDDVLPITETDITDGAISTPKLAANSVIAGKIASGAITTIKLDAGAVTTSKITAGAITAAKIAAGTITANEIASDAITTNKIVSGAITTIKLGAGAVTAEKIGANEVTANKIDVADLYSTNATIGATLTLGTGGEFTNAGGNFTMDASGLAANYTAGSSGLFLDFSNGEAEFSNVTIRDSDSTIGGNAKLDNLTVTGTLTMGVGGEIKDSPGNFIISDNGMDLEIGSSGSGPNAIVWRSTLPSGTVRGVVFADSANSDMTIYSSNGWDMRVVAANDLWLEAVNDLYIDASGDDIHIDSNRIGFYGVTPTTRPKLSGSSFGGSQVLKDLVVKLDSLGLIDDQTTP